MKAKIMYVHCILNPLVLKRKRKIYVSKNDEISFVAMICCGLARMLLTQSGNSNLVFQICGSTECSYIK